MRKCFQSTICRSWFWLDKCKNFGNILSCNISWQYWPNIKKLFEKSPCQRWFSKWDITYWFYNDWQRWTYRIDWTITYPSLELFSYEFYSRLSGSLNGISVPFTKNLANLWTWKLYLFPVTTLHKADRFSRASLDNDFLSAKSLKNGPPACSSFSTLDVHGWVFVVGPAVIS